MSKYAGRKLAFALFLLLLAGPADRAFASGTGSSSAPPSSSTTTASPAPSGITGTDPEPTSPDIVSVILTLINLA